MDVLYSTNKGAIIELRGLAVIKNRLRLTEPS